MASISYSFGIDSVSFSKTFDTYVNIQKRREGVDFSSTSIASNVNLAYCESEDIESDVNLTISDRSTSLVENRTIIHAQDEILASTDTFNIETDQFLVTDIFNTDFNTQSTVPLFYKHVPSATLVSGEFYSDIKVLDQNFNQVVSSNFLVQSDVVYSNLKNEFNPHTGLSTLFFVTYVIKRLTGELERHTEILNNQPVYREATIEDIDPDTSNVFPGIKAYLIAEGIADTFIITMPSAAIYGLRRTNTNRIEIIPPPISSNEDPWFVRIHNGKFIHTGVTGINKYYIAEFAGQSFSPSFPFKSTDETSFRVSSRIVKTLHEKIALSISDSLYPSVIVYNKDGTAKFAVTANPSLLGEAALDTGINYSNAILGDSKIAGKSLNDISNPITGSSLDLSTGLIVLPAGYEIAETDIVRTIYHYSEVDYEVTTFNFNPLESSSLLNKRVVFFIRPEPLGSTLTQTLYYLLVNEDGLVVDNNIDFSLVGAPDTDPDSELLWYDREPADVFWAIHSGINFVRHCSVEGADNQDDMFILGDVFIREAAFPDSVVINDIRIRGGGVQPNGVLNAIETNTEVEWYWDIGIWDGKPYPGAAAIFVDVPVDVVDVGGGVLSPDNIRDIVSRHIATGIYPVVHSYNIYQPAITGVDLNDDSSVTLHWTAPLNGQVFDVWQSDAPGGPYTLYQSNVLANVITIPAVQVKNMYAVLGRLPSQEVDIIDGSIFQNLAVEATASGIQIPSSRSCVHIHDDKF